MDALQSLLDTIIHSVTLFALVKGFIILNLVLTIAAFLVYAERKISAWMQYRVGPNRVGPFGLLQPLADVIKLYTKEDIIPTNADRFYHALAPLISIAIALALFCVISPAGYITDSHGEKFYIALAPNVNVGILIILALTSLAVYGVTLAGWSSNNKYSLMGGLRSSAQMISYELSMGLALIAVLMISGSLDMNSIIASQAEGKWNIFFQPIGFIIFMVASFAETNRAPFDLPEAEPELVGGYHTEYSGMKFGLFYLAEYANIVTSSAVLTTLYLGGYDAPFAKQLLGIEDGSVLLALVQFGTFAAKVGALLFFFIWVRWTLPRFRYDQLMNLGWKVMLPVALVNILVTGGVMSVLQSFGIIK
jgi:NADH-quinone oxidoreductase subunit H